VIVPGPGHYELAVIDVPMSAAGLVADVAYSVVRFTPGEALTSIIESGAVLVDTRDHEDRKAEGAVPGAVHIPRSVLEWRADATCEHRDERLVTGAQIIVMCSDGYSSVLAASNLVRLGHSGAADIIGGFRAWKRAGLPVE
jgi:rhodanese-related sulfurtransferase